MHFGMRDEFEYIECSRCGCLQIKEIPANLSSYYPTNYYSYSPAKSGCNYTQTGIRGYKERFIRNRITNYYLNRTSRLGRFLERKSSISGNYSERMNWMRLQRLNLGLTLKSSILDVGCGTGHLLQDLAAHGFSQLMGIDPFIEHDLVYESGVRILKQSLDHVDQQFDFIMLHHSFEHLTDPLSVLQRVYSLLKPKRYCLIRIPLAGSYAWVKYGVNWVALDAPRHLHLHTPHSMKLLSEQAGFELADVVFDGEGFGLIFSEQYLKGIPLVHPNSHFVNPADSPFSKAEIEAFKQMDQRLNATGEADAAGFYLRKN